MAISTIPVQGLTNGGTPVADYWYLNTSLSVASGTDTIITANLSQLAFAGTGVIGSMSQSSGVFTFPQTGLYRVTFSAQYYSASFTSRYLTPYILVSTDGGSNYTQVIAGQGSLDAIVSASNTFVQIPVEIQVNVTSTSNVKVKFGTVTQNACNLNGGVSYPLTWMTFTRLGNSV